MLRARVVCPTPFVRATSRSASRSSFHGWLVAVGFDAGLAF
jgi:hypothetical protein